MSKLDVLIEKYKKQFDKYGMGSGISYSELISDLEKVNLEKTSPITKEDIFTPKAIQEINEYLKHIKYTQESLEALKLHISKK